MPKYIPQEKDKKYPLPNQNYKKDSKENSKKTKSINDSEKLENKTDNIINKKYPINPKRNIKKYNTKNKFCKGLIAFSLTLSLASGINYIYNMREALNNCPEIANEYLNNKKIIRSLRELKQENKDNPNFNTLIYPETIKEYEKINSKLIKDNKELKKYNGFVDNMTYSFCSFLIGLLGLSSGIIGKTISSRKKKKLEEGLNNEELESSA